MKLEKKNQRWKQQCCGDLCLLSFNGISKLTNEVQMRQFTTVKTYS